MMRNSIETKRNSLQIVKNHILSIIDLFKEEQIAPDDYQILLLLISLYKDDLLSQSLLKDSEKSNYVIPKNSKVATSQLTKYLEIFPIFLPVLKFMRVETLNQIIQQIQQIDQKFLSENFTEIFDKIIHQITHTKYGSLGSILQPKEVTQLMIAVSDIRIYDSVFNPFAGLASFSLGLKNDNLYYGQEINKKAWALGKLRLIANGKNENIDYALKDSISNWPDKKRKFDIILSSPPFYQDLSSRYIKSNNLKTYKTAEQFVIENSLNNLKKDGKLIVCVTTGFLNKTSGEEQLIKHLIDNDLIDSIIPFQYLASRNQAILLIKRKKEFPGRVKMYNTSKFLYKKNEWGTEFKFDQLHEFILEKKKDDGILRLIENKEIKENNFILHVPRYFQKKIEGIDLKEVVELVIGERINQPQNGKLILTRDLKQDSIDFYLDLSMLEEKQSDRLDLRCISESCLLITTRFDSLKPTFFNYTGTPIFKGSEIVALKIDESKVNLSYLINELSSDYINEQIESIKVGTVFPLIRTADILALKIKIPPINEQIAKVQGANNAFRNSKLKESKLEERINSIRDNFNEELREKQHCIRQHLKNVVDSISVLNSFIEKQNGTINLNDVINPYRNITVAQRFVSMNKSIRSLSVEIDNLTNDELYDNPELVGIRDIISECILEFGDTVGFSIQENIDELALEEYGEKNPKITVSKRSFKELFNNIIMNASKHGFIKNRQHQININISIKEGKLNLTFLNNGKPFANGLAKQLGMVKGKKAGINAGSGIGVWKIFKIAEFYGFECQIMDLPEEEFPVGWNFKFTLTEIN